MRPNKTKLSSILLLSILATLASQAQSAQPVTRVFQPVPPPEAPVVLPVKNLASRQGAPEPYSIGNVTAEEQLYVELINRSRANPQAELALALANPDVIGALEFFGYFDGDTNLLVTQYATITPAPPVAFNAQLNAAARRHVLDMKNNVALNHTGSDGSTFSQRIQATGYPMMAAAENIYHAAEYVEQGHYAFEIDWGVSSTGIQQPPGHRNTIHNGTYREVGIAVEFGSGTVAGMQIGPQLVAQEFATQQSDDPFITGVCYYDLNGNNFYDIGEGIGGVLIENANGGSAISASSGGYSLPVSGNGTYNITFSIQNAAPQTQEVTVSNNQNVKVDYTPAYTPPTLSGPDIANIGKTTTYTFAPVAGAVNYEVRQFKRATAALEGAENPATVTITTMAGYQPVIAGAARSGANGFHLTHLNAGTQPPPDQIVLLNSTFMIQPATALEFYSKLGTASLDQKAQVQISTDEGASWTTIYNQAGTSTGSPPAGSETTFNLRSISLADYAGKFVKIRFVYKFQFGIGIYIPDSALNVGWVFDDILLRNAFQIFDVTTSTISTAEVALQPTVETTLGLQVRANLGPNYLEYGPVKFVQSSLGDPEVSLSSITATSTTQFVIEFELLSGKVPSSYTVEARSDLGPAGSWIEDVNAQVTALGDNRFRVNTTALRGGALRFYRVRANP